MNDFAELENELKKLQPAQPSAELIARIEHAFASGSDDLSTYKGADPHLNPLPEGEADAERQVRVSYSTSTDDEKIIHPARFHVSWLSVGLGLAAAAAFLVFANIRMDHSQTKSDRVAQNSPLPETRSTITSPGYLPAGASHVTYNTRDEGLHFARGYEEPLRRTRTQKRETQRWRNPDTGASLQISYPSEEVVLTPVSGQ
ncbi:MAG: hypothetical protein QOI96_1554 [Verrucomicrobiota bacterium]